MMRMVNAKSEHRHCRTKLCYGLIFMTLIFSGTEPRFSLKESTLLLRHGFQDFTSVWIETQGLPMIPDDQSLASC